MALPLVILFLASAMGRDASNVSDAPIDKSGVTPTWSDQAMTLMQTVHVTNPTDATVLLHRYGHLGAADSDSDDDAASVIYHIVELVVQAIIWYIYHTKVLTKKPCVKQQLSTDTLSLRGGMFQDDFCSCLDDFDTLALACCARPCRIADTYLTAGLIERSNILLTVLGFAVFGTCLNCCYFPCKRTALREHLGGYVHPNKQCGGCCGCGYTTGEDFVLVSCFHWCSIIQEARAIDTVGEVKTTKFCSMLGTDDAVDGVYYDAMNPVRISREPLV